MKINVESIKVNGYFHDLLITGRSFTLQEEGTEQWESAKKLTGYQEQQFSTWYPLDSDLLWGTLAKDQHRHSNAINVKILFQTFPGFYADSILWQMVTVG